MSGLLLNLAFDRCCIYGRLQAPTTAPLADSLTTTILLFQPAPVVEVPVLANDNGL